MSPRSSPAFVPSVVAALATLAPTAPAAAKEREGTELLRNGGFEQGISGWNALNLKGKASFEPDAREKKSGAQSLRIERTEAGRSLLKQSADVPSGVKTVVARCWYRVDKGARAQVDVYLFDAAGETIGNRYVPLVGSGPTKRWEKAEERLEVPKEATGVGVNVVVEAKGTFWLDGLELVAEGGVSAFDNGGFERGLDGWMPVEPSSGATRAEADGSVRAEGKASARLARASARLLPEDGLRGEAAATPGRARVRFRSRTEGGARAWVVAQAFDDRGVCVATARAAATGGEAFAPGELAIDVPAGGTRLVVSLLVAGAGTAWFDAVALQKGGG